MCRKRSREPWTRFWSAVASYPSLDDLFISTIFEVGDRASLLLPTEYTPKTESSPSSWQTMTKQDKPPRPFDLQVPHSLTLKPFNSNTGIKFWSMPKCTKSNSKGAAGMTLIANTEREHMLWCFSLKVWILDSYWGAIQSQKSKLYHDGIHIYIYISIDYVYIYICIYWLCSYCTII